MCQAFIPDDSLRRRLGTAPSRGHVISTQTAQMIATKLTDSIGPGLKAFAATGVVTPELSAELAELYDLRRPEVERWLDALTRYVVHHPSPSSEASARTTGRAADERK